MRATKKDLSIQLEVSREQVERLVVENGTLRADLRKMTEDHPRVHMLEQALHRRGESMQTLLLARDQWREGATLLFEAMEAMAKARRADRSFSPAQTDAVRP